MTTRYSESWFVFVRRFILVRPLPSHRFQHDRRGGVFKDETINKTFSEPPRTLRKQLGVHKPISLMNVVTIARLGTQENGKMVNVVSRRN